MSIKPNHLITSTILALGLLAPIQAAPKQATYANTDTSFHGVIGKTLKDSKEYWKPEVKAPKGAPNVVWILLDDVGYGASSTFGGLIHTPNFDALADNGLRYTNFHTCAISAPTRASLLTGRNSAFVHESGFSHPGVSAGFPGWDGRTPATAGTIAEILRDHGYNTFAVGKYGVTPDVEGTDAGPFEHWPTGKGFDHFFGFLGSQTDQYKPDLVEDQAHVKPDGRHLNEQITDKAISYIDRQQKAAPGKPFFLYYAPGATHAPHQVDTAWSNKYKGKFDQGWDEYRKLVFANQKKLGLIPVNAILPERDPSLKPWNSLSADEKKLYARFMEVYAGYLEYTDNEVGKLLQHLKDIHQYDNTIVLTIIGDNGASKEGSFNGDVDRPVFGRPLSEAENIAHNLSRIQDIGTPEAPETNYPLGWAQAANTPYKLWKGDAQSEGGTHNPLIIQWPQGISEKGQIRNQYGHVIDILPTTLDLIGLHAPKVIRGIKQDSIQGISLAYSIHNAQAPSQHTQQYYYIFGNRSIYKDGWKAAAAHHPDLGDFGNYVNGGTLQAPDFDKDQWELYNLNEDPTERINLAAKYPEKLRTLKTLFDQQATFNHLYPLIDWYDVAHLHLPEQAGDQKH